MPTRRPRSVGSESAAALAHYGAKIIAISDHTAAFHNPKGIDVKKALQYVQFNRVLRDFLDSLPAA